MATILRRIPYVWALALLGVGVAASLVSVLWLAQVAGQGATTNTAQAAEITATGDELDEVSALATELRAGLLKANQRLRDNGAVPVVVPTATIPANGSDGADGLDGLDGAAGSPGAEGRDGSEGLPGGIGPVGVAGSAGVDGTKGDTGATGPKGDTGATGPAGSDGANGAPGADGAVGQPGANGADGQPPRSFTFTNLGVTYTCDDPEGDGDYTCTPT